MWSLTWSCTASAFSWSTLPSRPGSPVPFGYDFPPTPAPMPSRTRPAHPFFTMQTVIVFVASSNVEQPSSKW